MNFHRLLPAELGPDCHGELPRAELFSRPSCYGPGCMSAEEAGFVYALVRVVKPRRALETGCEGGFTTCAIAQALADNGQGFLHVVENDPRWLARTNDTLESLKLSDWASVNLCDSLRFIGAWSQPPTDLRFDFALLDSSIPTRLLEFDALMRGGLLEDGAFVVVHDTRPEHPMRRGCELFPDFVARQDYAARVVMLEMPSPRGMIVARIANTERTGGASPSGDAIGSEPPP